MNSENRKYNDTHPLWEQKSKGIEGLDMADDDRQTGGAVLWLLIGLIILLIACSFIAGNRCFERAEEYVEGIEMETVR